MGIELPHLVSRGDRRLRSWPLSLLGNPSPPKILAAGVETFLTRMQPTLKGFHQWYSDRLGLTHIWQTLLLCRMVSGCFRSHDMTSSPPKGVHVASRIASSQRSHIQDHIVGYRITFYILVQYILDFIGTSWVQRDSKFRNYPAQKLIKDCLGWHCIFGPSRTYTCTILYVIFWAQPPQTDHKLLTNTDRDLKVRRVFGKDTPVRTLFSSTLLKSLLGRFTPSRHRSKSLPNVKLWRLLGRFTPSRHWSKLSPNVKLCRLLGRFTPSRLWLKDQPNVKFCRLLGRFTPSRHWSKSLPNVKLSRLLGRFTPSRLWLKRPAKCQAVQISWQVHSFQALVERPAKCQALKTAWQVHSFQALVEVVAECQALKTAWQVRSFQALIEFIAECQAFQTAWQVHSLKALIEVIAECQALKTAWQVHSFQALVEDIAQCQALKIAWQVHPCQALVEFITK